MNPTYGDSFREVVPDIFSQVVDGVDKVKYQLKTGTIYITLIEEPQFDYRMQSGGSLDAAYVSSKVSQFFRDVQLESFYNISNSQVKAVLKMAFKQFVEGKEKASHHLGEDKTAVITYRKHDYYDYYLASAECLGLSQEEVDNVGSAINSLVEASNINLYFNSKSY